jgi:DNA-binding transcriptional regulator YiaG
MNKLGPYDEKALIYALKTVDKVMAGKRVKGWHKLKPLKAVPAEIKTVRKTLGVSQKNLAEIVGASLATVKAWESGARRPDGVATKVLRLLGQDPKMARRLAAITL